MYTLVIIDMQARFTTSTEPSVIVACKREIQRAMKAKAPVVFVEFNGFGETLPDLTSLTKGYDKVFTVIKTINDGSKELAAAIKDGGLSSNMRVCGVNTSWCVRETVVGLSTQQLPNHRVRIVADACNCTTHDAGLKQLEAFGAEITRRWSDNKPKAKPAIPNPQPVTIASSTVTISSPSIWTTLFKG